jgi:hypothetical protein
MSHELWIIYVCDKLYLTRSLRLDQGAGHEKKKKEKKRKKALILKVVKSAMGWFS